jgi:uncharacterized tellurite resistance protein B-like protein
LEFRPRRWQHSDLIESESRPVQTFKNWISRQLGLPGAQGAPTDDDGHKLAVAALLVEVLRADYQVSSREREAVIAAAGRVLGLGEPESAALVTAAEKEIDKAHDLYQFTSQVNQSFTGDEKVQLLEQLWRVAQADETVHKYEEHLIRRVADLLHVPHSGFIAAKLRASGGRSS